MGISGRVYVPAGLASNPMSGAFVWLLSFFLFFPFLFFCHDWDEILPCILEAPSSPCILILR